MPYLYKGKFAWLVPCFEVRFELRVSKTCDQAGPAHEDRALILRRRAVPQVPSK
jgi:hypothetical protein